MDTKFEEVTFYRFDQVQLRTTANVKYLSALPGAVISPHGLWSVAAILPVGESYDLLLVKQSATIRIPVIDVLKVSDYTTGNVTAPLGKLTNGQAKG